MSEPFAFSPEALMQHREFLRGLARGLLADDAGVDDVVQEAYVRALERPPRSEDALRAWLARVVQNLALNRLRGERRRAHRERDGARVESVPSSAEVADRLGTQRRVVDAVRELHEPYRTVIYLRWYEGLAPREIAARLERPIETVRSQLKRGHGLLREELDGEFGDRAAWASALVPLAGARPLAPGTLASTPWVSVAATVALTATVGAIAYLVFGSGATYGPVPSAPLTASGAAAKRGGDEARLEGGARDRRADVASGLAREPAGVEVPSPTPAVPVPAAPVRGRAVGVRTREPIPALTVRLERQGGDGEELLTDADGRFVTEGSYEPGSYLVRFLDGPDRTRLGTRRVDHDAEAADTGGEHALALGPTYRFELELPPGLALADLSARLADPDRPGSAVETALRPGATPWARFSGLPAASLMESGGRSMYALRVESRDGMWGAVRRVHAERGIHPDLVSMQLVQRGALRVVVPGGFGHRADLPFVFESEGRATIRARTDVLGGLELDGLEPGTYVLASQSCRIEPVRATVEVRAGETTELDLPVAFTPTATLDVDLTSVTGRHVPRGALRIERILDGRGAGPVADAVTFVPAPGSRSLELPVGEYVLTPPLDDGLPWFPRSRRVRVPGPPVAFECRDDLASRELAFRVFDAETGAALPTFDVVALVDRYRVGIRQAAALDAPLARRPARFDLPVADVPDGFPLAWVVEVDGYRSVQGDRADLALEGDRLVGEVRLPPSWTTRLWIGTRDEAGRPVPLAGARVTTSGGKLLAQSLGDGEVRLELLYDPGRLIVEYDGAVPGASGGAPGGASGGKRVRWRVASWEGYHLGRRRTVLDLHRVWLEREDG